MLIERIGPMDLTVLAADRAPVPMNTGAVILFDGPAPAALFGLLRDRVSRVPRLRQVLCPAPAACGRPVWVDESSFGLEQHFEVLERSGDDVFAVATSRLCRPLDPRRPLWRATPVTGRDRDALIVVLHHVVADGLGGLAVLAALTDEWPDHTFETNVRGPAGALHLGGCRIGELVPMVATPGNTGVTFAALSYAGVLTVSVIADPTVAPEHEMLAAAVRRTFRTLTR